VLLKVLQLNGVRQMSKLFAFLKDEIEYGLIAAGISVVIIATVNAIGNTLNGKFTSNFDSAEVEVFASWLKLKGAAGNGGFFFRIGC